MTFDANEICFAVVFFVRLWCQCFTICQMILVYFSSKAYYSLLIDKVYNLHGQRSAENFTIPLQLDAFWIRSYDTGNAKTFN